MRFASLRPGTAPTSPAVLFSLLLLAAALVGFTSPATEEASPDRAVAPAPITDLTWGTAASQPIGNSEAQAAVVNGMLYSFGGFDQQKACCTPTDRAYVYDPAADTWTSIAPLPGMPEDDGTGTLPGGVTHSGVTTDGSVVYGARFTPDLSGRLAFGVRVYPVHEDLVSPWDVGVRWAS